MAAQPPPDRRSHHRRPRPAGRTLNRVAGRVTVNTTLTVDRRSNGLRYSATLAALAARGAIDRKHRATPAYVRPFMLARNGTSGNIRHLPATLRKCLLSSRSRVRVAVGVQVRI